MLEKAKTPSNLFQKMLLAEEAGKKRSYMRKKRIKIAYAVASRERFGNVVNPREKKPRRNSGKKRANSYRSSDRKTLKSSTDRWKKQTPKLRVRKRGVKVQVMPQIQHRRNFGDPYTDGSASDGAPGIGKRKLGVVISGVVTWSEESVIGGEIRERKKTQR